LAVHGGLRATGVLNGGRPEGRLLASEEMLVNSRTPVGCWRRWWPVILCRRRPSVVRCLAMEDVEGGWRPLAVFTPVLRAEHEDGMVRDPPRRMRVTTRVA
jgi:hypothetical protein